MLPKKLLVERSSQAKALRLQRRCTALINQSINQSMDLWLSCYSIVLMGMTLFWDKAVGVALVTVKETQFHSFFFLQGWFFRGISTRAAATCSTFSFFRRAGGWRWRRRAWKSHRLRQRFKDRSSSHDVHFGEYRIRPRRLEHVSTFKVMKKQIQLDLPINQSHNQSIHPSIHQSIDQSINQSIHPSIDKSMNPTILRIFIDRIINIEVNKKFHFYF